MLLDAINAIATDAGNTEADGEDRVPETHASFKVELTTVSPPAALVYEYGCRVSKADRDHLRDQMTRSRRLYNELAALINATCAEAKTFLSQCVGEEAQDLERQLDALEDAWKTSKARDDRDALLAIASQRKALRTRWYGLLHAARREHSAELKARFLSRIGNSLGSQTYAMRCAAVDAGLDWATANEALASALGAFKKQWPRLKTIAFRHFDDPTQTATLQFTAAGGVPVEQIVLDRHSQIGLALGREEAGRRVYVPFRFRLGAGDSKKEVTGTVQYHRPLPPGSTVPMARLVERRIGKDVKHYLQLVIKLQDRSTTPIGLERQPLAVAHFGWYYQPEGRRIAEVASSSDPGLTKQVTLPTEIGELLDKARALESRRSTLRDEVVASVVRNLPREGAPEALMEELTAMHRLRVEHVAPRRLGKFVHAWSKDHPTWQAESLQKLQAWRLEDRMLWQSSAHVARRARNRRRKFYEATALDIVSGFSTVLLDVPDLRQAAKVKDEETGAHNALGATARSGRHDAALYELSSAIEKAGGRLNCIVGKLTGPTASICAHCSGSTTRGPTLREVACEGCGAVEDRASSAAAVGFGWAAENPERLHEAILEALDRERAQNQRLQERKAKRAGARSEKREARLAADGAVT